MARRDPGESHRLAELCARARILAAEGRLHVVAADVEPGNGSPTGIAGLRVGVGAQPEARAERRRQDRQGVERRPGDAGRGRDWGARRDRRCCGRRWCRPCRSPRPALCARSRCSRSTVATSAAAGTPIGPGQRRDGRAFAQVAAGDILAQAGRARPDQAETVALDEIAVADQPRRDGRRLAVRPVHGADKLVIGDRLVDKAPGGGVDRDQPGLGAVEHDVRIDGGAAVGPCHGRARETTGRCRAHRGRAPPPPPGRARWCCRRSRARPACARPPAPAGAARAQRGAGGKAAAGEHDAAPGRDGDPLPAHRRLDASDPPACHDQAMRAHPVSTGTPRSRRALSRRATRALPSTRRVPRA